MDAADARAVFLRSQPSPDPLDRPAGQTEVRSSGKHVSVIRPDITFSKFLRGSQMHSVCASKKDLARSGDHQASRSPQQRFVHWNEVPQSVPCVPGESGGKVARFLRGCHALAYAPMQYSVKLGESPDRRVDLVRSSNQFTNLHGIRFIQIKLRDLASVEIHGDYRSRSSSIVLVLSLLIGIRSQTSFMERKIRSFTELGMLDLPVSGRNSATG